MRVKSTDCFGLVTVIPIVAISAMPMIGLKRPTPQGNGIIKGNTQFRTLLRWRCGSFEPSGERNEIKATPLFTEL